MKNVQKSFPFNTKTIVINEKEENAQVYELILQYLNCITNKRLKRKKRLKRLFNSIKEPVFYMEFPGLLDENLSKNISLHIERLFFKVGKMYDSFLDEIYTSANHREDVDEIMLMAKNICEADYLKVKRKNSKEDIFSNSYKILDNFRKYGLDLENERQEVLFQLKESILIKDCETEDRPIYEGILKKKAELNFQ